MCEVLQYYKNQGRAEGKLEGKLELAVKMLEKNFSEETILSLGITKEQLAKAKNLCATKV
ncbi:MAG: hypothetical protein ACI39H_01235 [Lachnospiraceae bacterium]